MASFGEMAERSNAAVSKTVIPQGIGGSNPPLSVVFIKKEYQCHKIPPKASLGI